MRRSLRVVAGKILFVSFLGLGATAVVEADAFARPGGGQTFKGSSSSSSRSSSSSSSSSRSSSSSSSSRSIGSPIIVSSGGSSSSSGEGGSFCGEVFLFILIVVALIVFSAISNALKNGKQQDWVSGVPHRADDDRYNRRIASIDEAIRALHGSDDGFSMVLFEDFLYGLYTEANVARGANAADKLSTFLSPNVVMTYSNSGLAGVSNVVVGAMRVESIDVDMSARRVIAQVVFEANYTEHHQGGSQQSYYVAERWTLSRSPDAKSRPPQRARTLDCPGCGAPLEKDMNNKCRYCGQVTSGGDFDWFVTNVEMLERESRGPMLTGNTEEQGTNLPTVVAPDAKARYDALMAQDPNMGWGAFTARVDVVFRTFYHAWSTQDLAPVRPFLSDTLFETQRYWVETYKKSHLRNIAENARILGIHLARVSSDKYYDAITVRVFATCLDYTLDANNQIVSGSRSKERSYSEYWTFIRGRGRVGVPRTDNGCPNCGAPLAINMAGKCNACGAKVTSGEFDWVLSRIEQDEVYG